MIINFVNPKFRVSLFSEKIGSDNLFSNDACLKTVTASILSTLSAAGLSDKNTRQLVCPFLSVTLRDHFLSRGQSKKYQVYF